MRRRNPYSMDNPILDIADGNMVICKFVLERGLGFIVRLDEDGYIELMEERLDSIYSNSLYITPRDRILLKSTKLINYINEYNETHSNKIIKCVTEDIDYLVLSTKRNVLINEETLSIFKEEE